MFIETRNRATSSSETSGTPEIREPSAVVVVKHVGDAPKPVECIDQRSSLQVRTEMVKQTKGHVPKPHEHARVETPSIALSHMSIASQEGRTLSESDTYSSIKDSMTPESPTASEEMTETDMSQVNTRQVTPRADLPRKIHRVPDIGTPCFDPSTKRQLQPGEPIPDNEDETDKAWLMQRQRDDILDFSDLSMAEKEYITRWNAFFLEKQLTTILYLGACIEEFVQINRVWFAQSYARQREFMAHLKTFTNRKVISLRDVDSYRHILDQTMATDFTLDINARELPPYKRRGLTDCKCCEAVQPPQHIICSGKVSRVLEPLMITHTSL